MTVVHLVRHGEVHNPEGILYGRLPDYHLSRRGQAMAERVAESLTGRDITHVVASPLERAQETAAPIAAVLGVPIQTDPRVIESENVFQGQRFSGRSLATNPQAWRHLVNPFRPSWGEPYREVVTRMWGAVLDARAAAEGHEALIVSHQLPIWVTRLRAQGDRLWHNPRSRQCTVCSLTSFQLEGDHLQTVSYSEPAGDMIPVRERGRNFSTGGADEPGPPAA